MPVLQAKKQFDLICTSRDNIKYLVRTTFKLS